MSAEQTPSSDIAYLRRNVESQTQRMFLVTGAAMAAEITGLVIGAGPAAGFAFLPQIVAEGMEMERIQTKLDLLESKLKTKAPQMY